MPDSFTCADLEAINRQYRSIKSVATTRWCCIMFHDVSRDGVIDTSRRVCTVKSSTESLTNGKEDTKTLFKDIMYDYYFDFPVLSMGARFEEGTRPRGWPR